MTRAPDYCDFLIAALSEAGYPPTRYESRGGGNAAVWEPTPPWDVYEKARALCKAPEIGPPVSDGWNDATGLIVRTNREARP